MPGGRLDWNFDTHSDCNLSGNIIGEARLWLSGRGAVRRADQSYYTLVWREQQYLQNIYVFLIFIYLYPGKENSNIYSVEEFCIERKILPFHAGPIWE